VIEFRASEGEPVEISVDDWRRFAARASLNDAARRHASSASTWTGTARRARAPEGYYQVRGGIPYAIAKSLAAAPSRTCSGWRQTPTR